VLLAVAEACGATWVACADSDLERAIAERSELVTVAGRGHSPLTIRFTPNDHASYMQHYSVIANPFLWFIQHYLWPLAYEPVVDANIHEAWRNGYVEINRRVAETVLAVARKAERQPLVLTQDYHLYLAPRMIREMLPDASLQQFIHIPWPAPQYWTVLPKSMREAIVDGLLANDIVGLQTNKDVTNFLQTCEELMGLRVDHRERAVLHGGRVVWVRAYPVSVDVATLTRMAASAEVADEDARVASWRTEKLIVRVDRTDPAKNIIRGFLAYERLLVEHPELRRRVQFWAFLQPSRQDVASYREYLRRLRATAARINGELGESGWVPIRLELAENLKRAIAAYKAFDVLLVNPIYDGMNLVAKEGMLANQTDGALVLSENAGCHEQLGAHALSINPFDVDATAAALFAALTMPVEERATKAALIKRQVCEEDIEQWIRWQFDDIRQCCAPRRGSSERIQRAPKAF
jgi:trehalose 6-phosphate synthase